MQQLTPSLVLLLLSFGMAQDKIAKPIADVALTDLAFISGHNRGEYEGGIVDEHWSEPAGDSMMGMYRYIKNGKVQVYELIVIEQTVKGLVLHLWHFNPGLGAREEREVLIYLVHFTSGEAVFERPDKSAPITYRAIGSTVLESAIEHTGKKTEVFQYQHSSD
ncbi:MAG TPA: DUF6265 family protein [Terriglobales bacterium]